MFLFQFPAHPSRKHLEYMSEVKTSTEKSNISSSSKSVVTHQLISPKINQVSPEFSQSSVSLLNEFAALTEAASTASMCSNPPPPPPVPPANFLPSSSNDHERYNTAPIPHSIPISNASRMTQELLSPHQFSSEIYQQQQHFDHSSSQTPPPTSQSPHFINDVNNKRATNPPYLDRILKQPKFDPYFNEIRNLKQRVEILEAAINTLLSDRSHGYSLSCLKTNIPSLDSKVSSVVGKTLDISRVHLDRFCLSVLRQNIEPDSNTLASISMQLEPLYLHFDRKTCIAHIRKWFRKRREEMGMRIISNFRKMYSQILENDEERRSLQFDLRKNTYQQTLNIKEVIKASDLEVVNQEIAVQFSVQKISSFLERYEQQGPTAR